MTGADIGKRFNQALNLEKEGKYPEAILLYEGLIQSQPKYQKSYLNLGALYSKQGNSKKAIEIYQKALQVGKSPELYYNIGIELYRSGETETAIRSLKKSLEIEKRFLKSHILLAYCYRQLEKDDKTELYLTNAIRLDPKNRMALTALATLYFEKERWKECLEAANKVSKLFPNDSRMQVLLSEVHTRLGNFKQSFEILKQATSQSKGFTRFSDTIEEFKKNPEEAAFFDSLEKLTKNKLNEFRSKFEMSQENPEDFSPPNPQDALDLSLMYLFHGDKERALKYMLYAQKQLEESNSQNDV
ncbi:tetratricopeptide repeat protein [Leptospira interrogans]|uniref:TPR-repeat-containing protein n=14 Tax=Leptospira interrogans TaxID=173 RepID=Q8F9X7_LEPIN|nr:MULTISPECIES: tetratricopeptide repeat protein [Leptospira]EMF41911.1 tetratricopeptide repeat protein [Leptospira interrogans serovar Lora str. TE 1992]EMF72531.1 tetratricopeptide repeat protein [Leptospira interrogans serovar Canicola str. LT1962]EMG08477.1 tetratricopeptide repeat protein [Leptospira interrogans serovar Grippotyphosa str. LT2186]EMM93473.1 tetratricopeptide repeat protein [Leptospira interrogans serovar Zanoni str. LT2156]EMN31380.1 tetratricopeptide repeat protein [Lep